MKRFNKPGQARAAPALSARPLPRAEGDGLRPFPQHRAASLGQAINAVANSQEVVAGQLACLARKAAGAIGDQDFRLTHGTVKDNSRPPIKFNQPPASMLKAEIKPEHANPARCRGLILADQPRQGFMEAWC